MDNLSKIQAALDGAGLDAILLRDAKNRRYATGFRSSAGAAFISKNEAFFITDSRYIEAARESIKRMTVVQSTPQLRERDWIARFSCDCSVSVLGFEDECVTYGEFRRLKDSARAELRPAQDVIKRLRASKSPGELELIVRAQRIAEKAFEDVLGILKPGLRERDVAAFLSYRMALMGADGDSFDPIVVAGKKTSMPHGEPGDNVIKSGDFVMMDFGCVCEGYCSDMTRTVAVGGADGEMRRVYGVVLAAQAAGIAAARPGVAGSEVDKAARDVIEAAGFGECFGHGFGHGLGLDVHEAPSASPVERATLPEGTVISAEPGIYLPRKFGVRIEDLLYLTGDGATNITKTPKELLVI